MESFKAKIVGGVSFSVYDPDCPTEAEHDFEAARTYIEAEIRDSLKLSMTKFKKTVSVLQLDGSIGGNQLVS